MSAGLCFVAVPALDGASGMDFSMMAAKDRAEVQEILAGADIPGRDQAQVFIGAAAVDEFQAQYPTVALLSPL